MVHKIILILQSPLTMHLYMTSTEAADYEDINIQVDSLSTRISFVAVDDDTVVELNESVVLQFVHVFIPYISFLESQGEFLRDTTTVDIIDNDCKYYNIKFWLITLCMRVSFHTVDRLLSMYPFQTFLVLLGLQLINTRHLRIMDLLKSALT